MIRSLQYFAFAVPDLEIGRKFYTDFGMESREYGSGIVMSCTGHDQDQIILLDGAKKKRLHHICLGTKADEIGGLKEKLEAANVKLLDPPYDGARDGVWFEDADGLLVCLCVADEAAATEEPEMQYNTRGFQRRLNVRGCSEDPYIARPRRLGHILLFTTDMAAKVNLYTEVLGMRISDTMEGDIVTFLRNGNGSDHHVIALLQTDHPGFHHASFEFGTVDDIAVATVNLTEKGWRSCWGPGRHVVGSNYFHYFRDPWGSLVEHYSDMDFVDQDHKWEAKDWPLEGNFARWAADGEAPDDFLLNVDA